jgi:nucleotide-binding universal stress UspA family protein
MTMLPEIRKILYCTDLSEAAVYAFRYAVSLAKMSGAEVHALHAVAELSQDAKVTLKAYIQDAGGPDMDTILRNRGSDAKKEMLRRLDVFWAAADPSDQPLKERVASISVRDGDPADAILGKAKELDVDMIVMGTHEKGFSHIFLGSVAKTVMRNSKIPVVVVPLPRR